MGYPKLRVAVENRFKFNSNHLLVLWRDTTSHSTQGNLGVGVDWNRGLSRALTGPLLQDRAEPIQLPTPRPGSPGKSNRIIRLFHSTCLMGSVGSDLLSTTNAQACYDGACKEFYPFDGPRGTQ